LQLLFTSRCGILRREHVDCSVCLGNRKPALHKLGEKMRIQELIASTERMFEAAIFWARWILAPAYVVLVVCLLVLSYKTFEELFQLLLNLHVFDEGRAVLQVLSVVDLVLVLNLVLMIIFVGYLNFVSKIHPRKREDWPEWMERIDYSGLKVQLLGSIIAIASIKLLRTFIEMVDVEKVEHDKLMWMMILYCGFLIAVLIIAVVNKLKPSEATRPKT
jgi:uncharacterized protein (TIGR00645 family)